MKLFRFRGGVHPNGYKELSSSLAIEDLPIPNKLYIPLQQHIGEPADPVVQIGQKVFKGDLLGHSHGIISAPVHASSSGTITDIIDFTAPHPSGLPVQTIVLKTDGLDKRAQSIVPLDPFALAPEEIATRVGAAGIVGLGGATFPSAVKLQEGVNRKMDILVINGGECEPFLTCDDRLMRERATNIIDGIRIMLHALKLDKTYVAIESNKPQALQAMIQASESFPEINIVKVPTRYPMGWDKQLVKILTGREVPAGKRSADLGVIVHNVATAYAIHEAIRNGHPLLSRIVTISGDAIKHPKNIEVRIGTLVSELLGHAGLHCNDYRLVMGGPMMGQALPHANVPVVKGCNGIVALSSTIAPVKSSHPCIRCGNCITACPVGLLPLEMVTRIKKGDYKSANEIGLKDCISCASCSYVCPSNIPLVHYFNFAKGETRDEQQAQIKNEKTRKLAEAKRLRLEAIAKEKKEAAEARKAQRAAAKAKKAKAAAKKSVVS